MFQCETQEVPCLNFDDYDVFNATCSSELASPITVDEIVNHSKFCISIPVDFSENKTDNDCLNTNDYLSTLKGKMGIYHLWIDIGHCQDHEKYSLLCVYAGKGIAKKRIKSHIKEKWPRSEMLFITFYECNNRIAKYLEQLFLDSYNFYLNKEENKGINSLYARWKEERYDIGTETQQMADILSTKLGADYSY